MAELPFDPAKAHRWFAVELNNAAWDLCELPARTAEETERMIDAAHASVHHWRQVGTVLNSLRGQVLLVSCHVAAGYDESALRYAYHALELLSHAEGATPFDRVSVFGSVAAAMALGGKTAEAERLGREAREALAQLSDDDRRLARQLWKLD
ncbi:MAG TPA: hypothetical protein VFB96_09690 [Pirellulaceae bacterium]|jgi:hypothetical protein|nr:hypothetical protein [Pirellulaceae bacterium]